MLTVVVGLVVVSMLCDVDVTVGVACFSIDVDVCCSYVVLLSGIGLIMFCDGVGVMLMWFWLTMYVLC